MTEADLRAGRPDRSASPPGAGTVAEERMRYASGGLRQSAVALGLLLVLPFALGAFYMLARRAMDGLTFDIAGVALVALGLLAVTVMLALELLHATRARLKFGKTALSF